MGKISKCLTGMKAEPLGHYDCSHMGAIRQTWVPPIRKEMVQRDSTALLEPWLLVVCWLWSWSHVIAEFLLVLIIVKWPSHTWGKTILGVRGESVPWVASQNFSPLLFGGPLAQFSSSPCPPLQPGLQHLLPSSSHPSLVNLAEGWGIPERNSG